MFNKTFLPALNEPHRRNTRPPFKILANRCPRICKAGQKFTALRCWLCCLIGQFLAYRKGDPKLQLYIQIKNKLSLKMVE